MVWNGREHTVHGRGVYNNRPGGRSYGIPCAEAYCLCLLNPGNERFKKKKKIVLQNLKTTYWGRDNPEDTGVGGLHVVLCYTYITRRRYGCCDVRPSARKVCNSRESDFCFDGVARIVLLSPWPDRGGKFFIRKVLSRICMVLFCWNRVGSFIAGNLNFQVS